MILGGILVYIMPGFDDSELAEALEGVKEAVQGGKGR